MIITVIMSMMIMRGGGEGSNEYTLKMDSRFVGIFFKWPLGRFIKSKFWNFDNSPHFLCEKYHN